MSCSVEDRHDRAATEGRWRLASTEHVGVGGPKCTDADWRIACDLSGRAHGRTQSDTENWPCP